MAKQERSEQTRERIVRAAEELFARHGYEEVSVAAICEAAGVTKGAFYHHFPSKQSLFLAVLDAWLTRLEQELAAALERVEDVPSALEAMTWTAARALQDSRGKLPLFLAFWHRAARDPVVWQATIAPLRRFQELIARFLQEASAAGYVHVPDPDIAARALVAQGMGVLVEAALLPESDRHVAVLAHGLRWLLQGMAHEAETSEGNLCES